MCNVFFYKMTHDSGAAPCVEAGLLSLAICKPMIRTSAKVDDLVFGFAANSLHADNRLIYIARVTKVLPRGRYYEDPCYAHRADRIYECLDGGFARRADAQFHDRPGDLENDLGRAPDYPRATVLLSRDFRYFGADGSADYMQIYPSLGQAVEALRRGYLLHHAPALLDELLKLKEYNWRKHSVSDTGRPSSTPDAKVSLRGTGCGVVANEAHPPTRRGGGRC